MNVGMIFYICNAVQNPQYLNNMCGSKTEVTNIKRILSNKLVGKINEGTCPEIYDFMDHRKSDNPYKSKYGNEWEDRISSTPTLRLVRPVTDLMNHMATETTNVMKGTKYQGKGIFIMMPLAN